MYHCSKCGQRLEDEHPRPYICISCEAEELEHWKTVSKNNADGWNAQDDRMNVLLTHANALADQLDEITQCVCHDAYKSRGKIDPQCLHDCREALNDFRKDFPK